MDLREVLQCRVKAPHQPSVMIFADNLVSPLNNETVLVGAFSEHCDILREGPFTALVIILLLSVRG